MDEIHQKRTSYVPTPLILFFPSFPSATYTVYVRMYSGTLLRVANGGNQFGVGTVGSRLIIVAFVVSASGSAFTAAPSLGLDA